MKILKKLAVLILTWLQVAPPFMGAAPFWVPEPIARETWFLGRAYAGTTYYVDFTGGDDSNSGTSVAAAWKTMGKVFAAFGSGRPSATPGVIQCSDTVLFKRGESWFAAAASHRIWIVDYHCGPSTKIRISHYGDAQAPLPVIDGATRKKSDYGIRIQNSAYIEIDGIKISNYLTNVRLESVNNVRFVNGINHDANGECFRVMRQSPTTNIPSHSVLIEGNTISDCGRTGRNGEGIYAGITSGQDKGVPDTSYGLTVRNNVFTGMTHEAIEFKPGFHDSVVERNTIHDIGGGGGNGAIQVSSKAMNISIRYNRVYNIPGTSGRGINHTGTGEVIGNICWRTSRECIRAAVNNTRKVHNNRAYQAGWDGAGVSAGIACFSITGAGTTSSDNLGSGCGSGNSSPDPNFLDPVNGDFNLPAGSVYLGNGGR